MRINTYEYTEPRPDGWSISKVELGKVNLVVGDTASGKTRFLNTIFNLGHTATGHRPTPAPCRWQLTFTHRDIQYEWLIHTDLLPDNKPVVVKERLCQQIDHSSKMLVERTPRVFRFHGSKLPKLPSNTLSILILKEEADIQPIQEGFSLIQRRYFHADALNAVMPAIVPNPEFFKKRIKTLSELYSMDLPVNLKLYQLNKHFPDIYSRILRNFTSIFPSIKDVEIKDLSDINQSIKTPGRTPVLCVKENRVRKWISIDQLSSGVQKVLLILTDTLALPDGSIYMIDEYENSLGISAIDFLPSFLINYEKDVQFIITSHHPYIINRIPIENWLVFSRKGGKVTARYGQNNVDAYGKSRQESFIKLINDPFYSGDGE